MRDVLKKALVALDDGDEEGEGEGVGIRQAHPTYGHRSLSVVIPDVYEDPEEKELDKIHQTLRKSGFMEPGGNLPGGGKMGRKAKALETKEAEGAKTAEALVTKVEAMDDLELDSTVKAPTTEQEEMIDLKELEAMEKNGDPDAIKSAIDGAEGADVDGDEDDALDKDIGFSSKQVKETKKERKKEEKEASASVAVAKAPVKTVMEEGDDALDAEIGLLQNVEDERSSVLLENDKKTSVIEVPDLTAQNPERGSTILNETVDLTRDSSKNGSSNSRRKSRKSQGKPKNNKK